MESNPSDARLVLNTKELGKTASNLQQEIEKQKNGNTAAIEEILHQADALFEAAVQVGRSHSGSHFGYHGSLYFKDFEIPQLGEMFSVEWGGYHGIPPGWDKREPEEVKHRIEGLASATFAAVEDGIKAPLRAAKELQSEILIQLAPLHQLPDNNREKQLLVEMERFNWNDTAQKEYTVSALKSFPNMTRDSGAVSQGLTLPAHTYYEAKATQVRRSCDAILKFWDAAKRLLRQLQLAQTQTMVTPAESPDASNILKRYERIKTGALFSAAVFSSLIIARMAEFAVKHWHWEWLLRNPNSYSIQLLCYSVLLLFLIGLFVRRFRNYCWKLALIPLVVGVLQSLGGPR